MPKYEVLLTAETDYRVVVFAPDSETARTEAEMYKPIEFGNMDINAYQINELEENK